MPPGNYPPDTEESKPQTNQQKQVIPFNIENKKRINDI